MDDVLGAHGFVVFWPSGSKIKATFGEGAGVESSCQRQLIS